MSFRDELRQIQSKAMLSKDIIICIVGEKRAGMSTMALEISKKITGDNGGLSIDNPNIVLSCPTSPTKEVDDPGLGKK